MDTPSGRSIGNEPVHMFGQDQRRQDVTHAVDQILPQEPRVVVLKQSAQAAVADRANDHDVSVR